MKTRIPLSVFIVTAILVIYTILVSGFGMARLGSVIFAISPLLMIWMVVSVLRSKTFTGKDLEDGEEWGYADRRKEDLGIF